MLVQRECCRLQLFWLFWSRQRLRLSDRLNHSLIERGLPGRLLDVLHGHGCTRICHNEREILRQDIALRCILGQLLALLQGDPPENFRRDFRLLGWADFARWCRAARILSLNSALRPRYYCGLDMLYLLAR